MKRLFLALLALALASAASPAYPHAILDQKEAAPDTYHRAVIRIPHGCKGSPTTAIYVTIPKGIHRAKPQPKPGWTLTILKEPLPEPVKGPHDTLITERVSEIRWEGGMLPDEHFDDFAMTFKLPNKPGESLYFPTRQICASGEHNWAEIDPVDPAKGQPAPKLLLTPLVRQPGS